MHNSASPADTALYQKSIPPLRTSSIAPRRSLLEPKARFSPVSVVLVSPVRTIRTACEPERASELTSTRPPTGVQSTGNPCGFNASNEPFVQGLLSAAAADIRHAQTTAVTDEQSMAPFLHQERASWTGQTPIALSYAVSGKFRKHDSPRSGPAQFRQRDNNRIAQTRKAWRLGLAVQGR